MNTAARFTMNPFFGTGLAAAPALAEGEICVDATAARDLFKCCPAAHITPLRQLPALAAELGVQNIYLKDERGRLGLGSFKALGAAHAIAKMAGKKVREGQAPSYDVALRGSTFVCASAGNHGLSMAAGARLFGARAVVYLSDNVAEGFAEQLRDKGAEVMRHGPNYEASMAAALAAAGRHVWVPFADGSLVGRRPDGGWGWEEGKAPRGPDL